MEALLGIVRGLMADQALNESELQYLHAWLLDNESLCSVWPASALLDRTRAILNDGTVTGDELRALEEVLRALVGGTLQESGAASGLSTTLPVDESLRIVFAGKTFCFTGTFAYGRRSVCEAAVIDRGGAVSSTVRKDLDFLIVGSIATESWQHSSFGRKIEQAVALASKSGRPFITSERNFVAHLATLRGEQVG
jgi:NAD-dependent DNA ligase